MIDPAVQRILDDLRRRNDDLQRRVEAVEKEVRDGGPLERRLHAEFDDKLDGASRGLEMHVRTAIQHEMRPHLDKFAKLSELSEGLAGFKKTLEEAVELLQDQKADARAKKRAADDEEVAVKRQQAKTAKRTPWLVFAGVCIAALLGLFGAMIKSRL